MTKNHGQAPLPRAMVKSNGQGQWHAVAWSRGQDPWPRFILRGHGQPRAVAKSRGKKSWARAMARSHGQESLPRAAMNCWTSPPYVPAVLKNARGFSGPFKLLGIEDPPDAWTEAGIESFRLPLHSDLARQAVVCAFLEVDPRYTPSCIGTVQDDTAVPPLAPLELASSAASSSLWASPEVASPSASS